ncbi:MAG: PqqD family protein [Rhizobiaceae bacterium]
MPKFQHSILGLSTNASFRSLGDSGVILMTDSGQMYSCNETALDIIGKLDAKKSVGDIVKSIAGDYDVSPDVLLDDMEELVTYLISEGVLIESNAAS